MRTEYQDKNTIKAGNLHLQEGRIEALTCLHVHSHAWWCGGSIPATRLPALLTMRHFRSPSKPRISSELSDLSSTFRSSPTVTKPTSPYLLGTVKQFIMAMSSQRTATALPPVRRLSNDILHTIIKTLDPPTAVCCALACKTGRALVLEATAKKTLKEVCPNFTPRTNSTELPLSTLICQSRAGVEDIVYAHSSDRLYTRLMLQLKS